MQKALKHHKKKFEEDAKIVRKFYPDARDEEVEFYKKKLDEEGSVKIPYGVYKRLYANNKKISKTINADGEVVVVNHEKMIALAKKFEDKNNLLTSTTNEKNSSSKETLGYLDVEVYEDGGSKVYDKSTGVTTFTLKDGSKVFKKGLETIIEKVEKKVEEKNENKNKKNNATDKKNNLKNLPTSDKKLIEENKKIKKELQEKSKIFSRREEELLKDPLTNCWSRRKFYEDFKSDCKVNNLIVAFLDGDKFKNVNDTYGHDAGDEVLRFLSQTVFSKILYTKIDIYRYGGEEFLIISKESKDVTLTILESIRSSIELNPILFDSKEIKFTVSIGVSFGKSFHNISDLVNAADKNVYIAKETGRNKIVVDEGEAVEKNKKIKM